MIRIRHVSAIAMVCTLATVATAQPTDFEPASCLVFPYVDGGPATSTIVTITNTNLSRTECSEEEQTEEGDILVHYVYVHPTGTEIFNRFAFLSAGDTLTVLTDLHNPEFDTGYLMVVARNPDDFPNRMEAVDFDHLVGSAMIVQAERNTSWSYVPYAFEAIADSGDPCNRAVTDTDGDSAIDFDDVEYASFPRELIVESFFEEQGPFENQLTLMTTVPHSHTSEIDFTIWNNVERPFSGTATVPGIWWSAPLTTLSPAAGNLLGDSNELGFPPVETGWVHLKGNRVLDPAGNPVEGLIPPFLGVFAQFVRNKNLGMGHALQHQGSLDGLEIATGIQP